ncbi:MAG TPA: phage tail protein [Rhodocyclaceae bacterium]|nr:phage tail protein [Rhodocyclaceae bacterium]
MIKMSIRTNFPDVAKQLKTLPEQVANKAMARALNTTTQQGVPEMARAISAEFRVTSAQARKRLGVERAVSRKGALQLTASLYAKREGGLHSNDARGMNLINFVVGGKPTRTKKGGLRQLTFQIRRGGGRKVIPGAFIATSKATGGTAVFVRDGDRRMPISTITTLDIAQMFNTKRINQVVRKVMVARFPANFKRELRAVLKGYAK